MIVVFDFDHTLFCTERWKKRLIRIYEKYGVTEKDFWENYQKYEQQKVIYTPRKQFQELRKKARLPFPEAEFIKSYRSIFASKEDFLHEDALDLLKKLKQRHTLWLISFGDSHFQRYKIENAGIRTIIPHLITSTGDKKHALKKILRKYPGERVVFIDDRAKNIDEIKENFPEVFTVQIITRCCQRILYPAKHADALVHSLMEFGKFFDKPSSFFIPQIHIQEWGLEKSSTMAAQLLERKKVVVVPTETSYGIAADATQQETVQRVLEVKKRSIERKLPVMVGSLKSMKSWGRVGKELSDFLDRYADKTVSFRLWKRHKKLLALQKDPTVVMRMATHPFLKTVAQKFSRPFTITSANVSGMPSTFSWNEFSEQFQSHASVVDVFFNYGKLVSELPSTILDITELPPKILRQGKTKIYDPSSRTHLLS